MEPILDKELNFRTPGKSKKKANGDSNLELTGIKYLC